MTSAKSNKAVSYYRSFGAVKEAQYGVLGRAYVKLLPTSCFQLLQTNCKGSWVVYVNALVNQVIRRLPLPKICSVCTKGVRVRLQIHYLTEASQYDEKSGVR
ncbi:hypothetical protein NDU88_005711 [Pleurodeles waltl]|uniref:Uncharacterized protein n=1 Tax=Pleurodeles waltl TaxID=8319 RepID=A0AAV7N6M8_PLEWA|nr:hypothetical protein NDU88_005711 [Pleurodeles waltl]